jgi:hypothetical protein
LSKAEARRKVRGESRKGRKGEQGVLGDAAEITKVLREGGWYRADLVSDLFVCKGGLVGQRRGHAVEHGGLISEIMI